MDPIYVIGLLLVGWIVLVTGSFIAARLGRMPGYGWRLAITLSLIWAGVIALCTSGPPRLGIDLVGGVCLIYEFLPDSSSSSQQPIDVAQVERVVRKRLRGLDVEVSSHGARSIEVIIPGDTTTESGEGLKLAERVKEILERSGTLEFRIVANNRDHSALIERARIERGNQLRDDSGHRLAWWVPVNPKESQAPASYSDIARRTRMRGDSEFEEILVVNDDFNVTGDLLQRVTAGIDERGEPCVLFTFGSSGAERFGKLTGGNLPEAADQFTRKLGIILDGQLYSAPAIQSAIFDSGQITGRFSQQEVNTLVNVLNAGSLPGRLFVQSEFTIGPAVSSLTRDRAVLGLSIVAGGLLLLQLLVIVFYRLVGLAAVSVWYVYFALIEGSLLVLHVRQVTGYSMLALVFSLIPVIMGTLLMCALIRHSRRCGAEVRPAIRSGVLGAILPVSLVYLALLLIGLPVYVVLGGSVGLVGFILAVASVFGLLTCLFCFHSFLGVVERLVRNTSPTTLRILFPGWPRQEVLVAELASTGGDLATPK